MFENFSNFLFHGKVLTLCNGSEFQEFQPDFGLNVCVCPLYAGAGVVDFHRRVRVLWCIRAHKEMAHRVGFGVGFRVNTPSCVRWMKES
jgi:hypothetical protein